MLIDTGSFKQIALKHDANGEGQSTEVYNYEPSAILPRHAKSSGQIHPSMTAYSVQGHDEPEARLAGRGHGAGAPRPAHRMFTFYYVAVRNQKGM